MSKLEMLVLSDSRDTYNSVVTLKGFAYKV